MSYSQLTSDDRYMISTLRKQECNPSEIARTLGRDRSTISRELRRNASRLTGVYRPSKAIEMTNGRRRRSRRNTYDSRGRLADKRMIDERPKVVQSRRTEGHWEIDTVMGAGDHHCIVTLVERKHGYVLIGKLKNKTKTETSKRLIALIRKSGYRFRTITANNGTEFHDYSTVEKKIGVRFYFAHPYHSWERGSNENANGLIRQYFPKRISMAKVTQYDCNAVMKKLNTRPRKRYGFKTREQMIYGY